MINKLKFLTFIVLSFSFFSVQIFGQVRTKVLILGTFHMAGTVDKNKVENDDILGAKRQSEIKDILIQLAKFKPTKIFVENPPEYQIYWDSVYTDLQKDILPKDDYLLKNEIFQLGLKLSKKLNLEKGCVCVDWQQPDSTRIEPTDRILYKFNSNIYKYYQEIPNKKPSDSYNESFELINKEIADFNKAVPTMTLKDVLLKYNSKDMQRKLFYGNVLAEMDKNTYNLGVVFSNTQMFRNMNIFKNIVQKTEKSDKNIMVIYGAGHGEALRVMLQSHPQFEVIELGTILK